MRCIVLFCFCFVFIFLFVSVILFKLSRVQHFFHSFIVPLTYLITLSPMVCFFFFCCVFCFSFSFNLTLVHWFFKFFFVSSFFSFSISIYTLTIRSGITSFVVDRKYSNSIAIALKRTILNFIKNNEWSNQIRCETHRPRVSCR